MPYDAAYTASGVARRQAARELLDRLAAGER